MTTKGTTKANKSADINVDLLKAQIAELVSQLEQAKQQTENTANNVADFSEAVKIQQDDYIPVMSLLPYNLNLSTREGGQGNTKKFSKFGEVKKILYRDLVDIIEVHNNFLEAGYFYIMDARVIRQHGLDDIYSKILTKEKIEEILSTNSDECVNLYASANPMQQEIIIQLLVDKVKVNPDSANLNIIDRISRMAGVDIMKRAEDMKELEPTADNK